MSNVDKQLKGLYASIINNGELRHTRAGDAISLPFPADIRLDVRNEFPLPTFKSVPMHLVAGELLWFLSGKTDLHSLRMYQFGSDEGQSTIWTSDYERYSKSINSTPQDTQAGEVQDRTLHKFDSKEDLGLIYGAQWREFESCGTTCDQITRLIQGIKDNPASRYHIVSAWNPVAVANNLGALPPCHMFFQVYVSEGGYMDLRWYQRSVDAFLGLPFNIVSYGLLLHILAEITGYKPRTLVGSMGDTHIYTNQKLAVYEGLNSETYEGPTIDISHLGITSLSDVLNLKGKDFKGCVKNYKNSGVIKAPLSVG